MGYDHGVSRYGHPSMSVSIIHPPTAIPVHKTWPGCVEGPF